MTYEVRALPPAEFVRLANQAGAIFAAALGYGPLEPRVLAFPAIVRQHTERPDFRAFGAFEGDRLVGFTEGYTGAPGQWWHDVVAARLSPADRARWLSGAFELVELHVHPDHQRQGLGGRLHDVVLEGLVNSTAVLSTRRGETPAMELYRRRGWNTLIDEMLFPSNPTPFRILGLDLR